MRVAKVGARVHQLLGILGGHTQHLDDELHTRGGCSAPDDASGVSVRSDLDELVLRTRRAHACIIGRAEPFGQIRIGATRDLAAGGLCH